MWKNYPTFCLDLCQMVTAGTPRITGDVLLGGTICESAGPGSWVLLRPLLQPQHQVMLSGLSHWIPVSSHWILFLFKELTKSVLGS
jgi:hypothetical protein